MQISPLIIIQARLGSTRLPRKILKTIKGKSLLELMVERLMRGKNTSQFIIATTTEKQDDEIQQLCEEKNWKFFRGSERDVLSRYFFATEQNPGNPIVRLTSDCPLIEPEIIDQCLTSFQENNVDYLSNTSPIRSFPRGMDIEIFTREALEIAHKEAQQIHEREHVTPYFYQNPGKFKIFNVKNEEDTSQYRLTVDTQEDLDLITKIYENDFENRDQLNYASIINLLKKNPDWIKINEGIEQKKF